MGIVLYRPCSLLYLHEGTDTSTRSSASSALVMPNHLNCTRYPRLCHAHMSARLASQLRPSARLRMGILPSRHSPGEMLTLTQSHEDSGSVQASGRKT